MWCIDYFRIINSQETGHTSYKCPKNVLGNRAKPKKKERTMDNESENVKAWLNDRDDDDLGGSAFMFQLYISLFV